MDPVGPLPPAVYWRRRAVAVGVAVLVVITLIWFIAATWGGSATEPTAQRSDLTTDPTTTAAKTGTGTPSAAQAPPSSAPGAAPSTEAPGVSTTVPATDPPAASGPAPAETAPAASAAPGRPAADPPLVCPDEVMSVQAQLARPSYPVGEQPVFRLLISNTGKLPCTRDLDAALQSVTVYSADGTNRLWSSNDCFPADPTDAGVSTLEPGTVATFNVKWSATTSEPTCTAPRTPVPAGRYTVVASLAEILSPPVVFTVTQP